MVLLAVVGGFGWFWLVLAGFEWFHVLVTTVNRQLSAPSARVFVFNLC